MEGKLEGVGCLDHVKAGMGVVCLKNEASVFETFLRGAKKKKTKNDSRERERERLVQALCQMITRIEFQAERCDW